MVHDKPTIVKREGSPAARQPDVHYRFCHTTARL